MTNQDKIKYLRQYRNNLAEISRIVDEIKRWRSLAEKITPTLSEAPAHSSGAGSKLENAVERIVELNDQLGLEITRRLELRRDIEGAIDTVDDDRLRSLLRYRYIDGHTWEWIAETMHYDIDGRNIYKMHRKAISKLDTKRHISM